jgi:hypothetical protein
VQEKRLILRLRWTGPVPPQAPHPGESGAGPTDFGMQSGREIVLPGVRLSDGTVMHEAQVTAYKDAKGRVRFRGPCVQGPPDEPFLYLSYRHPGRPGWIGRGKAHLTSLTENVIDSLPDGTTLESTISNLGHRPTGHLQKWTHVDR